MVENALNMKKEEFLVKLRDKFKSDNLGLVDSIRYILLEYSTNQLVIRDETITKNSERMIKSKRVNSFLLGLEYSTNSTQLTWRFIVGGLLYVVDWWMMMGGRGL